jgi:hypothetical protein
MLALAVETRCPHNETQKPKPNPNKRSEVTCPELTEFPAINALLSSSVHQN